MRTLSHFVLAATLTILIGFGFQNTARAQAKVVKGSTTHPQYCKSWTGFKYCRAGTTRWQYVTTPSGNRKYQLEENWSYQWYHANVKAYNGTYGNKYNYLLLKGKMHNYNRNFAYNWSYLYKGKRFCYKYSYTDHYVNGKIVKRVDKLEACK